MTRTISPQDVSAKLKKGEVTVIDVRRRADYEADPAMIPGAVWRDPEQMSSWSDALPRDQEIVVYCVRGGSVSNAVIDHLQQKQLNARYIEGGIAAWKAQQGKE